MADRKTPEVDDETRRRLLDILNLPFPATEADINRAYRKLAKKLHPDTGDEPDASEFRRIDLAKQILLGEGDVSDSDLDSILGDPAQASDPSLESRPVPTPSQVDFGALERDGPGRSESVYVFVAGAWPAADVIPEIDPPNGSVWEADARVSTEDEHQAGIWFVIDLSAQAMADSPLGLGSEYVYVRTETSEASISILWEVVDRPSRRADTGKGLSYGPVSTSGRRRWGRVWAGVVVACAVLVIIGLIGASGGKSAPRPQAPSSQSSEPPTSTTTTSTTLPATVSTAFDFMPTFVPGAPNQVSSGSSEPLNPTPNLQVSVSSVTASPNALTLQFSAQEQGTLGNPVDDPSQSCVVVRSQLPGAGSVGDYGVYPVSVSTSTYKNASLTSTTSGSLVFPMIIPGSYDFDYGCDGSYKPLINLGTVSGIPVAGISVGRGDGPNTYFGAALEVRRAATETVVLYSAEGGNSFPSPDQSCFVSGNGAPIDASPSVTNTWSVSGSFLHQSQSAYVGILTFPTAIPIGSRFEFGCSMGGYGASPVNGL